MALRHLFRIKSFLLDCLFPYECLICKNEGSLFCDQCRAHLKTLPPSCFVCKKIVPPHNDTLFRGKTPEIPGRTCKSCRKHTAIYAFFSPFSFEDPSIRRLVHDLKYRRMRDVSHTLADLIHKAAQYYNVSFPSHAVFVPTPLHQTRMRFRGFNQSTLIAKHLSHLFQLDVLPDTLQKIKKTKPQVGLLGDDRRNNIKGSFAVVDPNRIAGRTVILLDDVKTTGATLEEAARTLRASGASRVCAISIAH